MGLAVNDERTEFYMNTLSLCTRYYDFPVMIVICIFSTTDQACVVFNLGALYTQLAAKVVSRKELY